MSLTLFTLLAYSVAIPALIGLLRLKKLTPALRVLVILFVVGLATEGIASLARTYFHNNIWVLTIYSVAELWIMRSFAHRVMDDKVKPIYFIIVTGLIVITYALHPDTFNSIGFTLQCLSIITLMSLILYKIMHGHAPVRADFLMVVVMLAYYTTSLIFFAFTQYLKGDLLLFVVYLHAILNAVFNLIYGMIVWMPRRLSSPL